MPEYRALAQNTYKFVKEVTFENCGNIHLPNLSILPCIKVISTDRSSVEYRPLYANASYVYSGADVCYLDSKQTYNESYSSSSFKAALGGVYSSAASFVRPPKVVRVVVEGVTYYGQQSYAYTFNDGFVTNSSSSSPATVKGCYLPAAKIKLVKYDAATATLAPAEWELQAKELEEYSYKGGTYNAVARCIGIAIPKATTDIILALEIEYPKFDIAFNQGVSGLQYSLDDGLTFQDVTTNLALEQVEHVVFKNTGSVTRTIGTTADTADVATIAAGKTFVAVPTADGLWYIS